MRIAKLACMIGDIADSYPNCIVTGMHIVDGETTTEGLDVQLLKQDGERHRVFLKSADIYEDG